MMENKGMEEKIIRILKESNRSSRKRGCSLQELHEKTGYCRATVSKYISILEAKKKIDVEPYGNMRIVYLKNQDGKD